MLSPLRNRFGIPGVISVIALVFAMLGGAYAASNDTGSGEASASAKRGKPGKPGKPGPPGPAGPQGPAGPGGAKGDTGAKGDKGDTGNNGTAGTNGKTVLSGAATPTAAVGALGDFYIETDVSKMYGPKAASGANGGWGTGTDLKGPEGPEGSPWTLGGTLPPGETLTGTYADVRVNLPEFADQQIPISFPIPLEERGEAFYLNETETDNSATNTDGCTGTVEAPTADPGVLCIYTAEEGGSFFGPEIIFNLAEGEYLPTGTVLHVAAGPEPTNSFNLNGTWAVTAPLP